MNITCQVPSALEGKEDIYCTAGNSQPIFIFDNYSLSFIIPLSFHCYPSMSKWMQSRILPLNHLMETLESIHSDMAVVAVV